MTTPLGFDLIAHPTGDFRYWFDPSVPQWHRDMYAGVFEMYETWFDVSFTEVDTISDDIWTIAWVPQSDIPGFTAYQFPWHMGGDAEYSIEQFTNLNNTDYYRAWWITMHEVGHGMSLDHPANEANDQLITTMMSYNGDRDLITPSYLDIEELGELYGLVETRRGGDDTYYVGAGWSHTIWDSAGHDALRYGGAKDTTLNLNDGSTSRVKGDGSFTRIASGEIEDAYGGRGDDRLIASLSDNYLWGGGGADTFHFHGSSYADGDTIGRFQTGVDRIKIKGLDDWAFRNHMFLGDTNADGTWDLRIHVDRGVIREDDIL